MVSYNMWLTAILRHPVHVQLLSDYAHIWLSYVDSAQLSLSSNKATLGHAVLSNGVHGQMEYNEHL